MRLLVLSCVVIAAPAWAQSVLFLSGPESQIDLKSGSEVVNGGDVLLQEGLLLAPGGIRRSGGAWGSSERVEVGAKLEVRDTRGNSYEVAVQSVEQSWVSLAIVPIRKEPPPRREPRLGTFKVTHWSINGAEANPSVPELTLKAEGGYQFGGATGTWNSDEGGVALFGPYAHWGRAGVRADGNELVFAFGRGGMRFEVVMTRER
jgi:hypothetical protein